MPLILPRAGIAGRMPNRQGSERKEFADEVTGDVKL
jgi:hypothetical protein